MNYPLSTPGPQLKRFKAGLCEFAQVVVRSCRNSLIYDEYLFPSLLAMLTGLSDSQVRAFRHTSTLLGKHIVTQQVYEIAMIFVLKWDLIMVKICTPCVWYQRFFFSFLRVMNCSICLGSFVFTECSAPVQLSFVFSLFFLLHPCLIICHFFLSFN